jgi:integrase
VGSIYRRRWKDKDGNIREGEIWWVKYYKDGKPFFESSESTRETDAKKLLKRREGAIINGEHIEPKFGKVLIDELLADVETDYAIQKQSSLPDLKRRNRLHLLPYFGGRRAGSITTTEMKKFIEFRQEAGASNGEINRELSALRRAYNLAIEDGKLKHMPKVPMTAEADARAGFFEHLEYELVLEQLPEYVRPVIRFAYITGWRIKSEVLTLKWIQIDFEGGVVRLWSGKSKNREPRQFPLTKDLRALLEEQGRAADALIERGIVMHYVFFNPKTGGAHQRFSQGVEASVSRRWPARDDCLEDDARRKAAVTQPWPQERRAGDRRHPGGGDSP